MPRQKREVIFGKGELSNAIYDELRTATGPLSSRYIAREIIAMRGVDARDTKYLADLTKRVSKALRAMREAGEVKSVTDAKGNVLWERRARESHAAYALVYRSRSSVLLFIGGSSKWSIWLVCEPVAEAFDVPEYFLVSRQRRAERVGRVRAHDLHVHMAQLVQQLTPSHWGRCRR